MNKAPVFQHRHYKAIAAMLHEAIYAPNAEHKTLYQVRDQLADMFANGKVRS